MPLPRIITQIRNLTLAHLGSSRNREAFKSISETGWSGAKIERRWALRLPKPWDEGRLKFKVGLTFGKTKKRGTTGRLDMTPQIPGRRLALWPRANQLSLPCNGQSEDEVDMVDVKTHCKLGYLQKWRLVVAVLVGAPSVMLGGEILRKLV